MAIQLVRYDADGDARWAVHQHARLTPLSGDYPTTESLFTSGGAQEATEIAQAMTAAATPAATTLALTDVSVLSPITRDADYICQGMNYASHLAEIGRDVADAEHNVFFMKASSCICAPDSDIVRPPGIEVLDYENELGLVLRRAIDGPIDVTADNLHEWIGAFVMTNDVSAREDQISAEQFYKAKSYRTFGPTGPFLVLVDADEVRRWGELVIRTLVNDEVRQDCPTGDMVFKPVATLHELSRLRDMRAGDMIATGTPGGVAMKVPGRLMVAIAGLLPKRKRLQLFLKSQAKNPKILRPGDTLQLTLATPDGAIDLGSQTNEVVQGR